jgi:methionyl aminopeptidase
MTIDNDTQFEKLKAIGGIVAAVLQRMMAAAKSGMTTAELDALGAKWLADAGARSAPILTYNFPGATCISVAPACAHGIPGEQVLQDGDLVNIDVSAEKDGVFADTGGSFVIGTAETPEQAALLAATRKVLAASLTIVKPGARFNEIGRKIETVAAKAGLTIIENLCSHGVGDSLHEEPKEILPYYDARDRRVMARGQVFTIEPFLSTGGSFAEEQKDGWTLTTPGVLTAQFEHTLVVSKNGPIIVTKAA